MHIIMLCASVVRCLACMLQVAKQQLLHWCNCRPENEFAVYLVPGSTPREC